MNRHVRALLKHYRGYGGQRKLYAYPFGNGDLSLSIDLGNRSFEIVLPEAEAKELVADLVEKYHGFSKEDLAEFDAARGDA